MKIVAVRIRGRVDVHPDIEKTLYLLRLRRKNVAVILEDKPSIRGMLKKVENWITWGEIDIDTLSLLLEKRGRLRGDKKITIEYLRKLGFNNFKELAEAILEDKIKLDQLPNFKPFFRLHPPKGGFKKTIKKPIGSDGELGYRGKEINELIKKMC
ncbi:MAG TPA: 50S ribosomal protein L30 [Thermoprotei archaeon]|nr:50S ribosomal protein L30 [Thermoprotei archaeon]